MKEKTWDKCIPHSGWIISFVLISTVVALVIFPSFQTLNLPITVFFDRRPAFGIIFDHFSEPESWGAWTEGKSASITFANQLPNQLIFEIVGHGFGPNVDHDFVIRIGQITKNLKFKSVNELRRVHFYNIGRTNQIEISTPIPTSPNSIKLGPDERKLGLAISYITLREPSELHENAIKNTKSN